jgi:hypothetical protein
MPHRKHLKEALKLVDKAKKSKNHKERKGSCENAVKQTERFMIEYKNYVTSKSKVIKALLPNITKAFDDAEKLKGSKGGEDVYSCLETASKSAEELDKNLNPKLGYLAEAIRLIKEGAESGGDFTLIRATGLLSQALNDYNSQITLTKDRTDTLKQKISFGLGWLDSLNPAPLIIDSCATNAPCRCTRL